MVSLRKTREDIAEEKLKQSEERYRTFVENMPDVVYSISAENETILSLSKAFEDLTGWSRKDWIGKAFLTLIHPDDLPLAFKTFQQALRGKRPPPYELRIRTKSGEYRVGEFTSSPLIENGKIIGEFGIVRDITARKKAESELKETKERLEYILGATKTNVDVIDSDFNLRYVDPEWIKTYGEPCGRKCYDYFMGRKSTCPTCGIPKALKTKKIIISEEKLPRENNRIIQVHTIPFRGPDGRWRVAEFNIDITERKRAEQLLRQSEEKFRLAIDNIPIFVGAIDKTGKFMLWNKYAKKVFGYTTKEAVGKVSPLDLHISKAEADAVIQTASTRGIYDAELNMRRKSGEQFPAHLVVVPYRDLSGKIVNFFGIAEDITERKKIDRMKDELIRDVTHELKTPLAMTEMAYDMCLRAIKKGDAKQIERAHGVARNNITRFRKDVESVLKAFTLEHATTVPKGKSSIEKAVKKILNQFGSFLKEKKLKAIIRIPPSANDVAVNKTDLEIIISNIIDNAIKFTTSGSVTISSERVNNSVYIKFEDTGIGMPPEAIANVFTRFYKQSSATPGVGLGIPICKEIVEKYGGKIEVKSKGTGKGTTVIVNLPRQGGKNEAHTDRGRRIRHAGSLSGHVFGSARL